MKSDTVVGGSLRQAMYSAVRFPSEIEGLENGIRVFCLLVKLAKLKEGSKELQCYLASWWCFKRDLKDTYQITAISVKKIVTPFLTLGSAASESAAERGSERRSTELATKF